MAFPTRLPKVGHGSEHFNERTWMCYHQTPPWERVVAYVGDAEQAKPHLEHNPLSLLGVYNATPMRKLNDPAASRLLRIIPPTIIELRRRGVCMPGCTLPRLRRSPARSPGGLA